MYAAFDSMQQMGSPVKRLTALTALLMVAAVLMVNTGFASASGDRSCPATSTDGSCKASATQTTERSAEASGGGLFSGFSFGGLASFFGGGE